MEVTTSGYSIYINGAPVGAGAFTELRARLCSPTARTTSSSARPATRAEFFKGLIDEVSLYSRRL
jgi:hypothetical protein